MNLEFTYPTLRHIGRLALNLREADKDEVFAASGLFPMKAIKESIRLSDDVTVALLDGEPIAIFGCARVDRGVGGPWFLATDRFYEVSPRTFLEVSRGYINKWMAHYPLLCNFVDARNTKSIRWLKACGFTIHEATPFGYQQRPFHLFTRNRHV